MVGLHIRWPDIDFCPVYDLFETGYTVSVSSFGYPVDLRWKGGSGRKPDSQKKNKILVPDIRSGSDAIYSYSVGCSRNIRFYFITSSSQQYLMFVFSLVFKYSIKYQLNIRPDIRN